MFGLGIENVYVATKMDRYDGQRYSNKHKLLSTIALALPQLV